MNISEIMTRDVRTCRDNDMMNAAAQAMWEQNCGCVPLVDGSGKAVGVITDRDICMASYTQGLPLTQIPVSRAASFNIVTVRDTDSIDSAETLMQQHRVRRLPVTDKDGRLVGIVSLSDLSRHAGNRNGKLDGSSVVRTLAAICSPPPKSLQSPAAPV